MGNDITATTTTVDSGATLQLNAARAITGDLTLADGMGAGSGGTLDLGLNTLTLSGNYTGVAGTTLNVGWDGAAFGILNAGGTADLTGTLNVTVGGTYIAGGATADVVVSGAALLGLPTTITDNSYVLSFTGAESVAGTYTLTAARTNSYTSAVTGGNAGAAAQALETAGTQSHTSDMTTVLNTLDSLGSAKEIQDAIDTMIPDVSSGVMQASRVITAGSFSMISNRLGGARNGGAAGSGVSSGEMSDGLGIWVQGLGSHMKQDERKGIQGFTANTWGATIGADKVIDRHFRLGLAGSYGWARVNSKQPGNPSSDINSFQGTLYGSYDSLNLCEARQSGRKSPEAVRSQTENHWYVDGMFAFTQNNYDSRREIWLTPTNKRVAKAEHYAQQYSTQFEAGYTFVFEETKALEITPFASLGYSYLYMNSYKEKGANALNLKVDGEGFNQLEQGLGTKLAYPMVAKKVGTFIPSVKAAWLLDYIGDRFETTASFEGGGPSFNTTGAKPAKNGVLIGAELAFLNKGNLTVTGNWDMELKDQFMSNAYYGTVRYDF
jgi:outer membrane autotransporter protein